jgi:hypothetical protein
MQASAALLQPSVPIFVTKIDRLRRRRGSSCKERKGKKANVDPCVIFLKQIDGPYGRVSNIEDLVFDFIRISRKERRGI